MKRLFALLVVVLVLLPVVARAQYKAYPISYCTNAGMDDPGTCYYFTAAEAQAGSSTTYPNYTRVQDGNSTGLADVATASGANLANTVLGLVGLNAMYTWNGTAWEAIGPFTKQEDAVHSSGHTGIPIWAVRKDTPAATCGSDGDYCALTVSDHGSLHIEPQHTVTIDEMDAITGWAVIGDNTGNLGIGTNHVSGANSVQFDMLGTGSDTYAGIEKTITTTDVSIFMESSGFFVGSFYVSSTTDIAYCFMRAGSDSSNYNEWRLDDDSINAGWNLARAPIVQPTVASTGSGMNTSSVSYLALGCSFDGAGNSLANITFDHIVTMSGMQTSADITENITSVVNSANVNLLKVGNKVVDTGAGTVGTGTQRVTLASDGPLASASYVDDADWTDDTSKHVLIGGVYQSTPDTVTDGDTAPFLIDTNGHLQVDVLDGGGYTMVDDSAFTVATDSGTPMMCTATSDTIDSGDVGVLKCDTNRNLNTLEYHMTLLRTVDDVAFTPATGSVMPVACTATSDTVDAGDAAALRCDVNRNLFTNTAMLGGNAIDLGSGAVGSATQRIIAATDSPDVVDLAALEVLIDGATYVDDDDWTDSTSYHFLTGGIYQSSPQTITDGDTGPLQVDSNGNLKVNQSTSVPGYGRLQDGDGTDLAQVEAVADNTASSKLGLFTNARLMLYDGATWDMALAGPSGGLQTYVNNWPSAFDEGNGYVDTYKADTATYAPTKTAATAVDDSADEVLADVSVLSYPNWCVWLKNVGGGSGDALADADVQVSPDGTNYTSLAWTDCDTLGSGSTCVYCASNAAYAYVQVYATCGGGDDTTVDAWLTANKN